MAAPSEFVTTGVLVGGKLKTRNPEHFAAGLKAMKDGEVLITVAHPKATRDARLNRLYWAGYVRPLSEHTGYTPDEIHEYLKARFLPQERIVIVDNHGEVKDDRVVAQRTTTTLTKDQFKQYLVDIADFSAELGVLVGSQRGDNYAD